MSELLIIWSVLVSQIMLGLAMVCALYRVIKGPRAQDRILGLDTVYITAMLLLLTFGIALIRMGMFRHAAQDGETRFDGRHARPQQFHRGETGKVLQVRFAPTDAAARANRVIDV